MDASSSDRSVGVGRTDSVSTLNYRSRASCTGDTACQEGTRRESKQANRYVQVGRTCIERDLSLDILGYFMVRKATFGWLDREYVTNRIHLSASRCNIHTYLVFYNVTHGTCCNFRIKCFDNKNSPL